MSYQITPIMCAACEVVHGDARLAGAHEAAMISALGWDDDEQPYGYEYCEDAPDERHSVGWYAGRECSWCQERREDD